MSFILDAKNAFSILTRGEWREFLFRLQVYLGLIDLRNASIDVLGLPAERSHEYSNSGGLHLEEVLNFLNITPQDSIVDFGSGKGGALITFSKYPFAKITGVELSSELVVIAKKNFDKLKIKTIQTVVGDAADFTDLEEYNYFYFFNPFPESILKLVMANIENSLSKKPRNASVIYLNPEYHYSVIKNSSFSKVAEFNHHRLKYYLYSNDHTSSRTL